MNKANQHVDGSWDLTSALNNGLMPLLATQKIRKINPIPKEIAMLLCTHNYYDNFTSSSDITSNKINLMIHKKLCAVCVYMISLCKHLFKI